MSAAVRVLVTGAGGQLAVDLAETFAAAGFDVYLRRREELDITSSAAVSAALDDIAPAVLLNPAAYNRVDEAERDPAPAFAANAFGPRALAGEAARRGCLVVHYSTDYVVDGRTGRPVGEDEAPLPCSTYATSKLAGEYFVRALAPRHYILRVCGLFGLGGRTSRHGNFVETMLRAAQAGRALRVVADQIVAPTSTRDVASATLALVQREAPYGLYHCTAGGAVSWYEYARAIFELAGVRADLSPTTAVEYAAPAVRPAYSILDNAKLQAAGIRRPQHWRVALGEYLAARGMPLPSAPDAAGANSVRERGP